MDQQKLASQVLPMPLPVVSFSSANGISVSILPIEVQSTSLQEKKQEPIIVKPEEPPKLQVKSSPAFAVKSPRGLLIKAVKPFLSNEDAKSDVSWKKEAAFSVQGLIPNFVQMYKPVSPSKTPSTQAAELSAAETRASVRIPAFSVGGNLEGNKSQSSVSIYSSQRSLYESGSLYRAQRTLFSSATSPQQNSVASSIDEQSPANSARRSVTFGQTLHAPAIPPATAQLSEPVYSFSDRAGTDELGLVCGTPSSPREIDFDEPPPPPPPPGDAGGAHSGARSEADFMAQWTDVASRRFEQHVREAGISLSPAQRERERQRFVDAVRREARHLWRDRAPSPDLDPEPFAAAASAVSAAVA